MTKKEFLESTKHLTDKQFKDLIICLMGEKISPQNAYEFTLSLDISGIREFLNSEIIFAEDEMLNLARRHYDTISQTSSPADRL